MFKKSLDDHSYNARFIFFWNQVILPHNSTPFNLRNVPLPPKDRKKETTKNRDEILATLQ